MKNTRYQTDDVWKRTIGTADAWTMNTAEIRLRPQARSQRMWYAQRRKLHTDSFHSTTHFSIHGTRLMTTNSRTNRLNCWMSLSFNTRVA